MQTGKPITPEPDETIKEDTEEESYDMIYIFSKYIQIFQFKFGFNNFTENEKRETEIDDFLENPGDDTINSQSQATSYLQAWITTVLLTVVAMLVVVMTSIFIRFRY